jgi:toxin ParE1/3/4
MYRLVVRKAARTDVLGARVWYEQASQGVAARFLDSLEHALESVLAAPERWQIAGGGIRRVSLRGFPYSVYYGVRRNDVVVVTVMHHRRDPLVWRRRVCLNEPGNQYAATEAT